MKISLLAVAALQLSLSSPWAPHSQRTVEAFISQPTTSKSTILSERRILGEAVTSTLTLTSTSTSTAKAKATSTRLFATLEETTSSDLDNDILSRITEATTESKNWAESFDLTSESGAAFHALFSGIRSSANLGLRGKPFHLKSNDVLKAMGELEGGNVNVNAFDGFFTFDDLAHALEADFLDADRGSTDNRKGWKVSTVVY